MRDQFEKSISGSVTLQLDSSYLGGPSVTPALVSSPWPPVEDSAAAGGAPSGWLKIHSIARSTLLSVFCSATLAWSMEKPIDITIAMFSSDTATSGFLLTKYYKRGVFCNNTVNIPKKRRFIPVKKFKKKVTI